MKSSTIPTEVPQTPAAPAPRSRGVSLALRGIAKSYAGAVALDGISLDVRAGEFVTFLGPSGSGKTTTLNLIAGFIEPDAGEILLNGEPISRLPPHKRNVGMVFQNYALFPHMTAAENIAFPLRQRRVGKRTVRERVQEALDLVRLGSLGGRYPRELSGGQQQRIALARAIVFHPHVLLMDEPLGALDRKLREAMQLEIMRIHREIGITFVYVTHDQEEALVMSDRIAIFNGGRIEQTGTSAELYERPRNLFVAEFIGESNILRGDVATDRGETVLECGWGRVRLHRDDLPPMRGATDVLVRPERISLLAVDDEAPRSANRVAGVIDELIYLGNTRKYAVLVDGGPRLIARVPDSEAAPALAPGDRVVVAWSPSSCVPLAADQAPPVDHQEDR